MENEIRQLKLMQAIAENKAAKSTAGYDIFFWLGIVALTLNAVAAILGAFFGCPCKDNKSCADYALTAVCVTLIFVAYVLSIINSIQTEKEKQKSDEILKDKIEQTKASNAITEDLQLAYEKDTGVIEQQNKRQRYLQMGVLILMTVANVVAMMAIFIP